MYTYSDTIGLRMFPPRRIPTPPENSPLENSPPNNSPPRRIPPRRTHPTENSSQENSPHREFPPRGNPHHGEFPLENSPPATYNNSVCFPISLPLKKPYDILVFLPRYAELLLRYTRTLKFNAKTKCSH